ncbi:MAG: phosphoribosylanthranilate isomerase [Leeuwenhoekiella sp.]
MKHNTAEVAALKPDYLGFIFYEKSPRNFDLDQIPEIPENIKKVGVFVDADLPFILDNIKKHQLEIVQLHGNETPDFCKRLKIALPQIQMWKVFSIKDTFDFSTLEAYETVVDKFLFDTKGKEKGGNGYTFDWSVLKNYPSTKPFILSGGIGVEVIPSVKELVQSDLPIYAIDVNSKFEDEPGLKNIERLKLLLSDFS